MLRLYCQLSFRIRYLLILLTFVAFVPNFPKKLSDMRAKENETVTFVCEYWEEKARPIWMKGGQQLRLTKDKKYLMLTDKKVHKLVIRDVTEEDSGEYTCIYREASTWAKLIVGGEC